MKLLIKTRAGQALRNNMDNRTQTHTHEAHACQARGVTYNETTTTTTTTNTTTTTTVTTTSSYHYYSCCCYYLYQY